MISYILRDDPAITAGEKQIGAICGPFCSFYTGLIRSTFHNLVENS